MKSIVRVYDPVARSLGSNEPRRRLASLEGKVVGFIDNGKPNFNYLVEELSDAFLKNYGVKAVVKRRKRGPSVPAPDGVIKEISEQCAAVITGSGD